MNGLQIEELLRLIECNIEMNRGLTRDEAAQYIRDNYESVLASLSDGGTATITISSGELKIDLKDLEVALA